MIMETVDTVAKKRKVEQLYEKYQKLMYVVAYHILNHHQDAVLESWEKIIRHMDKIDHIDSPKTKSFLVILEKLINYFETFLKHTVMSFFCIMFMDFPEKKYQISSELKRIL